MIEPTSLLFVLLQAETTLSKDFWEEFHFGESAHVMVIAALGSLLGEAILALNAYRHEKGLPTYYRKTGFWIVRSLIVLGATILPWAQGMKDTGVDRLVPLEVGLCAELLLSRLIDR